MRGSRAVLCTAALLAALSGGCREASRGSEEAATADSATASGRMVPNVLAGAGDAANEEAPACIRGGTSRADVRRILGEPDSVSFGAWLYGSSEIQFGYGVVVETRDRDGRLRLCP